jgi:8-oxo-dGTP pyrophosphatase MutT (NUDIX family)
MKLGAGFLILCPSTCRILTVLRNDPEPTWSILGGGLEKFETPIQCAKRELSEEADFIENRDYEIVSTRPINIGKYTHFVYRTYLAVSKTEIIPKLNYEHAQYKWVDIDNIPEPRHFGLVQLLEDDKCIKKIKSMYQDKDG